MLFLVIIALVYPRIWTLEAEANKTEAFVNTTGENTETHETLNNATEPRTHPQLLQAQLTVLQCFRLYSERSQRGYWSDMCDSNEALSPYHVWFTESVCAPGAMRYANPNYWLVYERSNFHGRYLLLSPGQCISNVRQYRMQSVGSILKCIQSSPYDLNLYCQYPSQPWRQYRGLSVSEAGQLTRNQPSTPSFQLGAQQTPMSNIKLSDIQRGSENMKNTNK
ncbi:unnamed protein product [Heterobilharzia americana]|nr:unnamed protein product [Heterobilharzia americana]CAH8440804.1 unnamed protein product [Heterobilharzia americana]